MSSQRRITVFIIIVGAMSLQESMAVQNSEMAEVLHRPIRDLGFPDNSAMGLFFAISVPLVDPEHSISLSYFFEGSYTLPTNYSDIGQWDYGARRQKRSIDRQVVYQALESKFESAGFPGRECLLRSICETNEWPIRHNGILGDILHVILTPSSSRSEDISEEYGEAERVGRNGTCSKFYSLCPVGLFDMIGTFVGV